MSMVGCDHPGYLCWPGGSSYLVSHGSVVLGGSLKHVLGLAVGYGSTDLSAIGPPSLARDSGESFSIGPLKVSIRLFDSILNL